MAGYTLGLDLGANSIGWAVVDVAGARLIDAGVRIFPEGVDNFDTKKEKSKSEGRRVVRGMRRQLARRARRKRWLRAALVTAGLLPADAAEQARLDSLDPYELRRRGLDARLSPFEFGRALTHLGQRRGFLSNRKSDRERKQETQGMLAEINELANKMRGSTCRTLGEYLARCVERDPLEPIRGQHTHRAMLADEFEKLWESQRRHHPQLLTDALKYGARGRQPDVRNPVALRRVQTPAQAFGIYGLIFFQRPMYWPKSVVGACELEPRRRRCPRADRMAQRFRLLQEVNNLRYLDPAAGDEHRLSPQHRNLLLGKLSKTKEMTFDQIRKALGFIDSIQFNLEGGKRAKLPGAATDCLLADKRLFGPDWHKRPENEKTQVVRTLIHGDELQIREQSRTWGLDGDAAERLLAVDLPAGYARLSLEAIEKLLPHLERGLLYMTGDGTPSALSEAGYLRPDQRARAVLGELPEPPPVSNPVVRQAIHELRKVVNSVRRRSGKPSRIHLEFARNATVGTEERQKIAQRMRGREAERDRAAAAIREYGIKVTREAIDRYLLWQEQSETCIYSGKPIIPAQLFGGEVHIDHILPRSRTLDDSFANKVVCLTRPNADKRNQTPYEWLAQRDPKGFEKVCQRAAGLPYNKRRRFTQKELELDKFIERQLNDTRYINRLAREYLQCLVDEPHHVLCPKGNHTERMRWLWGLNSILREDAQNRKNRCDHRHHAIDAIVVALTDHDRLQALSQVSRDEAAVAESGRLAEPWKGFREQVMQRVEAINVSHRPRRKLAGALHEDTIYGKTRTPGEFVVRKPIESLTPSMVDDIRDPAIRRIVLQRLEQFGIGHGRGSRDKIPAEAWKQPLTMPSGVPIKRVRLLKRDRTIRPIRQGTAFVKPGSMHHVCLFEWSAAGKPERDAVFVSMLDAVKRARHKEPIIQRVHPERPDARFIMSLSAGEMVLVSHGGAELLCTFQTAASTSKQMWFRLHTAGGRAGDKAGVISKKPGSFVGRKVTVTPLGEIRWAND